jgi:hypothetical protein
VLAAGAWRLGGTGCAPRRILTNDHCADNYDHTHPTTAEAQHDS